MKDVIVITTESALSSETTKKITRETKAKFKNAGRDVEVIVLDKGMRFHIDRHASTTWGASS